MRGSKVLRVGSLFAGIGGFELGFERAGGFRVIWQVERDPFCRAVLARHWPDAERYDDVRTVDAYALRPVDVLIGGFPCQDISYAGKGAGLDGERSGLWFEFARLIRELRPRFVAVENVPGLLTRGFGRVVGDLAEAGYDAEWACLRASDVGAPHKRERVFIIGIRRDVGDAGAEERQQWAGLRETAGQARDRLGRGRSCDAGGEGLADGDGGRLVRRGESEPDWQQGTSRREPDGCGAVRQQHDAEDVGESASPRCEVHGHEHAGSLAAVAALHRGPDQWPARPGELQHDWEPPRVIRGRGRPQRRLGRETARISGGLDPHHNRRDRLAALGNAVVPAVAEIVARRIKELAR